MAAYHNISPEIYDIWYCSLGTRFQNKGLHMLMEFYPADLHDIIFHDEEFMSSKKKEIALQLDNCAIAMSKIGMMSYDIKSSNIVVQKSPLSIRFIDYGNDYCECCDINSLEKTSKNMNPVLTSIADQCRKYKNSKKVYESVLRISTLICLSANIHNEIHKRRRQYNLSETQRINLNPLYDYMKLLRSETPSVIVKLIKMLLRTENVKECTEHYNGNRNSCVKRMFKCANFVRDQ